MKIEGKGLMVAGGGHMVKGGRCMVWGEGFRVYIEADAPPRERRGLGDRGETLYLIPCTLYLKP